MNKEIINYADRVKRLSLYSSTNILKFGLIFHECKLKLSKNDYELFLNMTSYKSKGATERKWRQIGENYRRLKIIVMDLPPCWSTIHFIATRKIHEFDLLERHKIIKSTVTLKELQDFLNKKQPKKKVNINFKLNFDESITPSELIRIYEAIENIIPKQKCDLIYNKSTEELLDAGLSMHTQFNNKIN